jgi:hypothetical protein
MEVALDLAADDRRRVGEGRSRAGDVGVRPVAERRGRSRRARAGTCSRRWSQPGSAPPCWSPRR